MNTTGSTAHALADEGLALGAAQRLLGGRTVASLLPRLVLARDLLHRLRRWRGGDRETELLWGLYRRSARGDEAARTSVFPLVEWSGDRRAGADRSSWSLLKGLAGSEREGDRRTWRLLYFIRFSTGGNADHHP